MLPAADFVIDFACGNRDTSPLLLEPLFGDGGLITLRLVTST